jgi:uncharacterized small protein (DUF1192 family)
MDAKTQATPSAIDLLKSLSIDDIRNRIAAAQAEVDSLRVLLRAAKLRERREVKAANPVDENAKGATAKDRTKLVSSCTR